MKTIQFFKTPQSKSLIEWVSKEARLPAAEVQRLLALGSIYLNGKRLLDDQPSKEGDTLRLHTRPKRYPSDNVDWESLILGETKEFLVINKPRGIPSHPTLDNLVENQLYAIEKLRGQKCYPVQRLDIDTSGVCVIGKTPSFQKIFHHLLKKDSTKKYYLACCETSPPLGLHTHYLEKLSRPPHLIHLDPREEFKLSRLEILQAEPFKNNFKVLIRLLTGRTHQIRAQLAFLGTPLIGDNLYRKDDKGDGHLLHSHRLEFEYNGQDFCFEVPCPW